ncbi:MAG: hypothetical protein MUC42_03900 [Bryobacter sp.]|nr:hypothetical protein [Bryobacter sp.]
MTVGYHAPLPPAPTGVADYAAALLEALRRLGSVEVDPDRAEVRLYQIGNNPLHAAIYERALLEPGVVLLHDALLHHFLLGQLDEERYVAEFVYNGGVESEARALWQARARSAGEERFFRYPMLRRVCERARGVIVHNAAAAALVSPWARPEVVPHLYAEPAIAPRDLRAEWGIAKDATVFGVFGYLRETKRLAAVLRAFSRLSGAYLVVAGRFVSSDYERALAPLLAQPGVIRLGFGSDEEFWQRALAVDAVVNLKWPTAGESSGIAVRFMGLGKTVILSATPENAEFPETTCLRVDPGAAEEEMLTEILAWLAQRPHAVRTIGAAARAHIQREHDVDRVARRIWSILLTRSR